MTSPYQWTKIAHLLRHREPIAEKQNVQPDGDCGDVVVWPARDEDRIFRGNGTLMREESSLFSLFLTIRVRDCARPEPEPLED
eukprot:scaffold732_cov48-Attheya_sp.AAC.4